MLSRNVKTNSIPFLKGHALGYIIMTILFAPLSAMVSGFSWKIFYGYMILFVIFMIIIRVLYNNIDVMIVYNSIVAFLIYIQLSIHASVPFYSLVYGTTLFYFVILISILTFIYSFMIRRKVSDAFNNPTNSKMYHPIFFILIIFLFIGGLMTRNGQDMVLVYLLEENQRAFFQLVFIYLLNLIVLFVSTALLVDPAKEKQRKSN